MAISKSPGRHTFQYEKHHEKLKENPDDENALAMVEYQKSILDIVVTKENDEEWAKDNLEYDLRTTDWILEKTRKSSVYAQNLYAAMCNTDFIKNEVWPLIKEEKWSCSWRHAGGIIADMLERGDYVDWYCSGIIGTEDQDTKIGYIPEGVVTEEIREDLLKLGWTVISYYE